MIDVTVPIGLVNGTDLPALCAHHEFCVTHKNQRPGTLSVQCVACGQLGEVDDPTLAEWRKHGVRNSSPYRWIDDARVRVLDDSPRDIVFVVRVPGGGYSWTVRFQGVAASLLIEARESEPVFVAYCGASVGEDFPSI
jgi:hypothetical protein